MSALSTSEIKTFYFTTFATLHLIKILHIGTVGKARSKVQW